MRPAAGNDGAHTGYIVERGATAEANGRTASVDLASVLRRLKPPPEAPVGRRQASRIRFEACVEGRGNTDFRLFRNTIASPQNGPPPFLPNQRTTERLCLRNITLGRLTIPKPTTGIARQSLKTKVPRHNMPRTSPSSLPPKLSVSWLWTPCTVSSSLYSVPRTPYSIINVASNKLYNPFHPPAFGLSSPLFGTSSKPGLDWPKRGSHFRSKLLSYQCRTESLPAAT